MISKEFKIVFMGTPDFAVHILAKLVNESCNIVGIITAPDKPAGRGQHIQKVQASLTELITRGNSKNHATGGRFFLLDPSIKAIYLTETNGREVNIQEIIFSRLSWDSKHQWRLV